MNDENKLTINKLFLYLRQNLIDARAQKNTQLLTELGNIFDLLEAAAIEVGDRKYAAIAEEMRSSVRDTFMGTEWKSNIPSIDEIEKTS